MAARHLHSRFRNPHRGAVIITVTALLLVLLMFGSMAVDLGYLYVIRNQLQNAADAGALAAARNLYVADGTAVNPAANQIGYDTATANNSQGEAVEVHGSMADNSGDVQRGHWSFQTRTFTANSSLDPVELWDVPTSELDLNPDFINAVRVVTRREDIPAKSFLTGLLGYSSFDVRAEAVGYIGFVGSLLPGDVDQPIAICRQAIEDSAGNYSCSTGRMIDSGGGTTHNTGAWTNFSQPCQTASAVSVRPLVCGSGNPPELALGAGMGTTGGMQSNVFDDLRDCWRMAPDLPKDARGYPTAPWQLKLPVIDCPGNNPGPCSPLTGAVTLNVLWINQSGTDPQFREIPYQMEGWTCSLLSAADPDDPVALLAVFDGLSAAERQVCWGEFADSYVLKTADDTSVSTLTASDLQKTMFFLPDCSPHELAGNTGGANYGMLAKIPVLVN